jgi:hypothetical protein
MQMQTRGIGIAAAFVLALVVGCDRAEPTSPAADLTMAVGASDGAAPKQLSISLCSPSRGGFTIQSTNPYFPMDVGRQLILTGEENGESIELRVTVLDRTRVIAGVTTRVIEEREFVDGVLAEVTWNYHVEASDGTNCYYGEDVDIYEDGGISHDGAWCAETPGNQPGIFMPADPRPGVTYQNEVAPGVAEDEAKIVGSGPREVPFGRFSRTIRIREYDPLTGDKDFKVYASGVGVIVDGPLQLTELKSTSGAPEQPTLTLQACGS